MNYIEFKRYMAKYDHTYCPITLVQYDQLAYHFTREFIYGLACDMLAGFTLDESMSHAITDIKDSIPE